MKAATKPLFLCPVREELISSHRLRATPYPPCAT